MSRNTCLAREGRRREKLVSDAQDEIKETYEYQKQLRRELRSDAGLVFHLDRIIRQRRNRRKEEKIILTKMRESCFDPRQRITLYSYLLDYGLEWFDVFRIPNDANVLQMGRRGSGKTWCSDFVFYTKRKVLPFVYVVTSTAGNGAWEKRVHPDFIFDGWDDDVIEQIRDRQKKVMKTPEWGVDPRVGILFDDMAADSNMRHNPKILEFAFYGRHYITLTMVTTQYYKQLKPGFRDNADIIFLYKMDNEPEKKAIWEEHSGNVPWPVFETLVNRYSTDVSCLVIAKNGSTPLTRFYTFRAPDPGRYRLGCASCWETPPVD